MRNQNRLRCVIAGLVIAGLAAAIQTPAQDAPAVSPAATADNMSSETSSVVPRLITFSGVVKDAAGKVPSAPVTLTFSLYQAQEDGSPLWSETQQVRLDAQGHYTVMLGATEPAGLPLELFTSGQARWLGILAELPGVGELPRVLLVGVPYALKAADAETLGGKPASAYVTTESIQSSAAPSSSSRSTSATGGLQSPATVGAVRKASSTGPLTVACKNITADGTATANFVAKFSSACVIHQSAIFENGGKVGIGTTSPAGSLDVHGNAFLRTILDLSQTTNATTGVITMGSSPFIHACCSSAAANTFVGVSAGNFSTTGVGHNTGGGFKALSSDTFGAENTAFGYFALTANKNGTSNTGIGHEALTSNTSGFNNTATGFSAMLDNSTGTDNTATGDSVLNFNITGSFNTAIGEVALGSNTTGSYNTGLGYAANVQTGNLLNATAIGAGATVSLSNGLVLGCTVNCPSGTTPPNVGIGTANPGAKLDIIVPNAGLQHLVHLGDTVGGSGDVAKIIYDAQDGPFPLSLNLTSNTGYARPFGIMGGNVGIGTLLPDNTLTVNGSADKPGGGSWGTFSDGRLKTVGGSYDAGLDAILKLTPVRYRYKEQNAMGIKDGQEHIGFVAQEVEKVIPEAVTRNNRGYLLVNNDPILWTMLNAIKQQQAEIEALKRSGREKDAQLARFTQQMQAFKTVQRQMTILERRLAQVEANVGNNPEVALATTHTVQQ